jgi:cupin fold WbuC family metalloprotein
VLVGAVDVSTRGRVRINLHNSSNDPLHEMLIAIRPGSYIRPHKHPGKSESFHLIHGSVDIVVFNDDGDIRDIVELAAGEKDRAFYYRMSVPMFHTLIVRSDLLIVHEITNGPFRAGETVFADFAPLESDAATVADYQAAMRRRVVLS